VYRRMIMERFALLMEKYLLQSEGAGWEEVRRLCIGKLYIWLGGWEIALIQNLLQNNFESRWTRVTLLVIFNLHIMILLDSNTQTTREYNT
jgi:hypothetical protein